MMKLVCNSQSEPNSPQPPAPAEQRGGAATAVKPAPQKPKLDQLPPYKVLLHNDDVNDIPYVVESILQLTTLKKERAVEATMEADRNGLALLLVTHKEHAELIQDQFRSKRLTVTIEPA